MFVTTRCFYWHKVLHRKSIFIFWDINIMSVTDAKGRKKEMNFAESVHQLVTELSVEDPTMIRWTSDGAAFRVNPSHPGLGDALSKYFQRESIWWDMSGLSSFESLTKKLFLFFLFFCFFQWNPRFQIFFLSASGKIMKQTQVHCTWNSFTDTWDLFHYLLLQLNQYGWTKPRSGR